MWPLCLRHRAWGSGIFALLCLALLFAVWAGAYPPPLEVDDDETHEAEAHVVSLEKGKEVFPLYSVSKSAHETVQPSRTQCC